MWVRQQILHQEMNAAFAFTPDASRKYKLKLLFYIGNNIISTHPMRSMDATNAADAALCIKLHRRLLKSLCGRKNSAMSRGYSGGVGRQPRPGKRGVRDAHVAKGARTRPPFQAQFGTNGGRDAQLAPSPSLMILLQVSSATIARKVSSTCVPLRGVGTRARSSRVSVRIGSTLACLAAANVCRP